MHEVIQQVLAAEAEAKRLVEQAKADAERLRLAARSQSQTLIAQARQEARAEAERLVSQGRQRAEDEKRRRLTQAKAEIEAQVRIDGATRQCVAVAVVRCLCRQSEPADEPRKPDRTVELAARQRLAAEVTVPLHEPTHTPAFPAGGNRAPPLTPTSPTRPASGITARLPFAGGRSQLESEPTADPETYP
ncbi:MAG: ATP synthase F0 subunit B [Verrucomicrobia bacterium]|nr:ATP synthase F0 subunit B [Verrucomicrobiota bacterium]